jgi:lipid-binding SYLF domain-containing protein/osmotically-inducible protein OsmY
VLLALCVTYTWAQTEKQPETKVKELDRVDAAQKVLNEIMATPDKGIPTKILSTADCLAIIPSMIKVGLGFGGRYGKGISTCRTSDDHWSALVPIRIEGGSWGLQIGGQATDVVMVIANRNGLDQLLTSKFKVGGDISAAAGPVGRDAEASTDWKMRTQILTYSRSRGVFAGITLNGAVLKQDTDDTLALYGQKFVPYGEILSGRVPPPQGTQPFLADVAKYFRQAKEGEVVANKTAAPSGTKQRAHRAEAGTTGGTAAPAEERASRETQTGQTGNVGAAAGSTSQSQTGTTTTETTNPDQVKSTIQNALRNTPNLDANDVKIDVTSDSVVLSGSVPNDTAKGTVKRIAKENGGGRKVVDDNLLVK